MTTEQNSKLCAELGYSKRDGLKVICNEDEFFKWASAHNCMTFVRFMGKYYVNLKGNSNIKQGIYVLTDIKHPVTPSCQWVLRSAL